MTASYRVCYKVAFLQLEIASQCSKNLTSKADMTKIPKARHFEIDDCYEIEKSLEKIHHRCRIDSAMGTAGFLFCLCTWTTLCLGKRTGFSVDLSPRSVAWKNAECNDKDAGTRENYRNTYIPCIFVVFKFIYVDTYGCTLILCIHTVINNYMLIGSVSIGFHLFHQSRSPQTLAF